MIKRQRIYIAGRVQGVGFRPTVYRLGRALGLTGVVYNDTRGVTVELQGEQGRVEEFLERVNGAEKPALAQIRSCTVEQIDVIKGETDIRITASDPEGTALSQVTADMALCTDCLEEMRDKRDFRYRYPFINCTNCGPRYSIVKTIPYDRPNTTMSVFGMCQKCAVQYKDVADRRFHAQPVACGLCGPEIWLADSTGKAILSGTDEVIAETAKKLLDGGVVAIKGVGGFHLAADATNNDAVLKLRQRKRRDHKPFAVMAATVEKIREFAVVTELQEGILRSHQSPIVLLEKKPFSRIAQSVAEGVSSFGFMLCYAPLHYLLFEQGIDVLVMTSGNISDEPLICKNDRAIEKLGDIAEVFLMHDRDIYRQVDDSIVHVIDNEPVLLRRARGYVPSPVIMKKRCSFDIFAAGGDLKNTFCFVKDDQFICSEHIGDLEDAEVYHHYIESVEHLKGLFEIEPEIVVCDLHPAYFSTQYALSKKDVEVIQVQHHWAHIASVLAENNIDGPVIGIECDGTGYGTDGAIWGCECMIASLDDFERFAHLEYYHLAGGDRASKEAIRPILGLLKTAYCDELVLTNLQWLLEPVEPDIEKQEIILQQIQKGINTVQTSSLGRVFDAVAALTGLGRYNHFEAQLPMSLEAVIDTGVAEAYEFELVTVAGEPMRIELRKMIKQLVDDIKAQLPAGVIAAKFHNCIAAALLETAKRAREAAKLNITALSGGVFCNRYLTNRLINLLKENDFTVLFSRDVPSNDGGISLGQAAIAARRALNRKKQR
ncbi:MAG: carbamoyltransferase HypF [Candidatus Brocadiia bacterium]|nr:MAG: carbamoyltransferase HypF [Candidatus Brocadiia bacterium]